MMAEERTQYVVGLLFSEDRSKVALIRKIKPRWQSGKLNGIGGHVEYGESHPQAMAREFREETGVDIAAWELFATLTGPDFSLRFYCAFSDMIGYVVTTTAEAIEVWAADGLPWGEMIPNLRVLIPLALDQSGIAKPVHLIDDIRSAS